MTGEPPNVLQHPAEAPPSLGHLTQKEAMLRLRAARHSLTTQAQAAAWRLRVRAWAGRVLGRRDRYLQPLLAEAVDEVALYCDELADRLATLASTVDEVSGTYGEELARLRSEVLHLERTVAALRDSRDPDR